MFNMIFDILKYPNGALKQNNIFQVNLHQEAIVYTVNNIHKLQMLFIT